ncbi:hypothetical protein [Psychromicrobium lacuslunae]|uniref:Uncharacterized protein n=1 Tax=Psychromicrobium lacuslunae TaxID=1618207 RepID=A0A0D4BZU7_9MICC|nr:hypothetical protein [Psychromicrobium lacuslunae]AJT41665.1 hypothetical protein UM93_09355 [Psychromicrobium lacuslunae]
MEIDSTDLPIVWAVGVHLLFIVLAVIFTLFRKYSLAGGLAWLVTVGSLLLGLFWFLILGGGRKNTHANESVQMALDPAGGLYITLYIVITLIIGALIAWFCKRRRAVRV